MRATYTIAQLVKANGNSASYFEALSEISYQYTQDIKVIADMHDTWKYKWVHAEFKKQELEKKLAAQAELRGWIVSGVSIIFGFLLIGLLYYKIMFTKERRFVLSTIEEVRAKFRSRERGNK